MNLEQALTAIAAQLDLDAAQLIAYAAEDTIGGFAFDETVRKWDVGSLWEVEGKILYALTRALRPAQIAEFGTHEGCSATHFLTALEANGSGWLSAVDPWEGAGRAIPEHLRGRLEINYYTGIEWLELQPDASFDLLFEDMVHGVVATREWWTVAQRKIRPGGLLISHDAAHPGVGADVMRGIAEAGVSATVYAIEPSDCGLAIWRAPGVVELPSDLEVVQAVASGMFQGIIERIKETPWELSPDDLDDAVHAPVEPEEYIHTAEEMAVTPEQQADIDNMLGIEPKYGDWSDEWGNVVCENCGSVVNLPDGSKTIECPNCNKTINTQTGEIVEKPKRKRTKKATQ